MINGRALTPNQLEKLIEHLNKKGIETKITTKDVADYKKKLNEHTGR